MKWVQLTEVVHHWNVHMKAAVIFGIPKMRALKVKEAKLSLSAL